MKTTMKFILAICLLLITASLGFAMWPVVIVTKDDAKKTMDIQIRTDARGEDQVWVELEFKLEGKLKTCSRVQLAVWEGKKLLVDATLKEDANRSKPGNPIFGFFMGRSLLDKAALNIFVVDGTEKIGGLLRENETCYELELKEHAPANLLPKDAKEKSPIHSPEMGANGTAEELEAAKRQGAETAAQDIKVGVFRILYYGEPFHAGKPPVDDATGYRTQIVAGCIVSDRFIAEADAYNQAMRDWHAKIRPNSAPKK